MTDTFEEGLPLETSTLKSVLTAALCVVGFTVAASAGVMAVATSGQGDAAAGLSCLEEDQSAVTDRLSSLTQQTMDILPASARNSAAGEQIVISVEESTYFSANVTEESEVEEVRSGRADDPTIVAETDCETIDRISTSETPSTTLQQAISRGDISWRGTSATSDATVAYASKGVQSYHIVESGETGDVQNGTDGFTNGLVYN
jgi:hypothetical protein